MEDIEITDDLIKMRLLAWNGRLRACRNSLGVSQYETARATGIVINRYADIERLKVMPTPDEAQEIASLFNKSIEWLFPPILSETIDSGKLSRRSKSLTEGELMSISAASIHGLLTTRAEHVCDKEDFQYALKGVLKTLTHREQRVIELRFGLIDGRSRTLEEVGKEFDIGRERIRQIEAKALRRLRHPSRSRRLKSFLGEFE